MGFSFGLLVVLLIIGVALLVIEMFMPGFGAFGITGIIILVSAGILSIIYLPFGWYIALCELFAIALIFYIALKYIRKNGLNGKLVLTENLDFQKPQTKNLQHLYEKEGKTLTALRPYGTALIDGNIIEVSTIDGYIPEKTLVKVIDIYNDKIIVKKVSQQ